MNAPDLLATYRLQLHHEFGFREAAAVADYLAALGVSHLYSSPQLQAAPGSTHGYDVVDHSRVSDDLGGPDAHRELTTTLRNTGLGHVVDIVPNHMAIGGPENRWWWDVLENGPASVRAGVFDVEWGASGRPAGGDDRILLPVLGDHFVHVLAEGQLSVEREDAGFSVRYFEHRFPVSPRTLDDLLAAAAERTASDDLAFIAGAFGRLPAASRTDEVSLARRHRDKEVVRRLLARLLEEDPRVGDAIDEVIAELNGDRDELGRLLGRQNYRLAHWRTAGQELDYRRFFDVSTLAGLRTEDETVFADTHRQVLAWHLDGRVDGLRVDHPDGLRDPAAYFERLAEAAPGAWVVAEKILVGDEALPSWPVAGTTGYDYLNLVFGLFVDPAAAGPLDELYQELTGETEPVDALVARCKRLVLDQVLGADLARLTEHAARLCGDGARYGDYTRADLHGALAALLVAFPVYRSYVQPRPEGGVEVTEADRAVVAHAVAHARDAHPEVDPDLLELLASALLLELPDPEAVELSARFQQLSGPVMAKGIEDTAFYRHVRFVAANEVGAEPGRIGVSPTDFHAHNQQAAQRWPATMTTTSTHDTKRSEDVRARLAVLSEIPDRWGQVVRGWVAANAPKWGGHEPDVNAEYLLYQTLVGAHPLGVDRAVPYMAKAAREAKAHTSWLSPDPAYEEALEHFVRAVLTDEAFLAELVAFVAPLVAPGRVNSLAQLLLKLASPGVPDLYQGTELWDDSLVDPDNRRPVDFALRRRLLGEMAGLGPEAVLARADEGLPKLWVAHHALAVRRRHPECFLPGSGYRPQRATGPDADHVVALVRAASAEAAEASVGSASSGMSSGAGPTVAVVVPRLTYGRAVGWAGTDLDLGGGPWRDELTGVLHSGPRVTLSTVLARFPVALLVRLEL